MYLSNEDEKILNCEHGLQLKKALELLVALGKIYKAEKLIPITSAHLSGVSYKTVSDFGIEILKKFSNTKVKIKTTINPIAFDRRKPWMAENNFIVGQKKLLELFRKLGTRLTCSCIPYFINNIPTQNEHIAWAESSAVIYANSVLSARTNRESGISALASALIGKVPLYGLHINKNRKAGIKISIKCVLKNISDYGALGTLTGKIAKNKIPYFCNLRHNSAENLKALSAGLGATSSIGMYHIENFTPEYKTALQDKIEIIEITKEMLKEEYALLTTTTEKPELMVFGCPHATENEIHTILNKFKKTNTPIWICTSRKNYSINIKIHKNIKLIFDTCPVVSQIEKFSTVTFTNSAKCAIYLQKFCNQKVVYGDI